MRCGQILQYEILADGIAEREIHLELHFLLINVNVPTHRAETALTLFATNAGATSYLIRPDGTGDFPTIQAGLVATAYGDTLLSDAGTFTDGYAEHGGGISGIQAAHSCSR